MNDIIRKILVMISRDVELVVELFHDFLRCCAGWGGWVTSSVLKFKTGRGIDSGFKTVGRLRHVDHRNIFSFLSNEIFMTLVSKNECEDMKLQNFIASMTNKKKLIVSSHQLCRRLDPREWLSQVQQPSLGDSGWLPFASMRNRKKIKCLCLLY